MVEMRLIMGAVVASMALGTAVVGFTGGADGAVEPTPSRVTAAPVEPAFDARLPPLSAVPVAEFRIPLMRRTLEVAPGVTYDGWTFGYTVPGSAIRVRQGDRVKVTLVNESDVPHTIDFDMAPFPVNAASGTIAPGEELQVEFVAGDAGAFIFRSGSPAEHMAAMAGMYLPIIVDPRDGWGTDADREFVLVQSEFHVQQGTVVGPVPDVAPAFTSYMVFNGRANQYQSAPLEVEPGDRVRFFVVNAAPGLQSDFHVEGAVFDRVYPDGDPRNVLNSVHTYAIPAGGGAVFEAEFEEGESGVGVYAFVTHSFGDIVKGAAGLIRVGRLTRRTFRKRRGA